MLIALLTLVAVGTMGTAFSSRPSSTTGASTPIFSMIMLYGCSPSGGVGSNGAVTPRTDTLPSASDSPSDKAPTKKVADKRDEDKRQITPRKDTVALIDEAAGDRQDQAPGQVGVAPDDDAGEAGEVEQDAGHGRPLGGKLKQWKPTVLPHPPATFKRPAITPSGTGNGTPSSHSPTVDDMPRWLWRAAQKA